MNFVTAFDFRANSYDSEFDFTVQKWPQTPVYFLIEGSNCQNVLQEWATNLTIR